MQFSFHAAVAASSSIWIEENDQLLIPFKTGNSWVILENSTINSSIT